MREVEENVILRGKLYLQRKMYLSVFLSSAECRHLI